MDFFLRERGNFQEIKRALICLLQNLGGQVPPVPPVPTSMKVLQMFSRFKPLHNPLTVARILLLLRSLHSVNTYPRTAFGNLSYGQGRRKELLIEGLLFSKQYKTTHLINACDVALSF